EEYAKDYFGLITEWGTWISAIQIAGTTTAGDFSVAATLAPSSPPAVLPGGSDSYTVTVSAPSGFAGTVSLAVSGLPAGASGSFSPGSVTFTTGGATAATSTLTVKTSTTTPGGTYTLTITGTGKGIVHTATIPLAVQGFSISVSPPSQTVSRPGS